MDRKLTLNDGTILENSYAFAVGERMWVYIYAEMTLADAFALLNALMKEQEPRVMQISEIMVIYKADPSHVWPYNTPPYLYIQEHPHVRDSSESWAAWREIRDIIEGELFGHTAQSYGKTWRCWTAKPTSEQMEATPWQ